MYVEFVTCGLSDFGFILNSVALRAFLWFGFLRLRGFSFFPSALVPPLAFLYSLALLTSQSKLLLRHSLRLHILKIQLFTPQCIQRNQRWLVSLFLPVPNPALF